MSDMNHTNNPRWTRWPFRGVREDTAMTIIGGAMLSLLLAGLLAAGLLLASCTPFKDIIWPTTVKCLTLPAEALVSDVRAIVEMDGLDAVFSQKSVDALEDLARSYGPDAVVCVLKELVDKLTAPTGAERPPEDLAKSRRVQAFLNDHDIAVRESD